MRAAPRHFVRSCCACVVSTISSSYVYIQNIEQCMCVNNNGNNSKTVKSNPDRENIKSVVHFLHFRFHLPRKYKITVIEVTSKSFLP